MLELKLQPGWLKPKTRLKLGSGVQDGSGFTAQVLGFGVQGLEFGGLGIGIRVQNGLMPASKTRTPARHPKGLKTP